MMKFNFPFHLVSSSPWPLKSSLTLMFLMMGVLKMLSEKTLNLLIMSFILLLLISYQWWRDISRESTYQGSHSIKVLTGLQIGMSLFIISELMFFFSFFWCYFHMYLSPSISLGLMIPPTNLIPFSPYNIPLLNTLILLSSGVTLTTCHHSMLKNKSKTSIMMFVTTLMLGGLFSYFQYMEYIESTFTMTDSMYGSIFFMATGFHGLHVLIGTLFILVSFIRFMLSHFSQYHHFGFEAASWYWHFVDVVWLFLYIFIYWLPFN